MGGKSTCPKVLVLAFYLFYSLFPLLYCFHLSAPVVVAGTVLSAGTDHAPLLQSDQRENRTSAPLSYVVLKKKRALGISFKLLPALAVLFAGTATASNAAGWVSYIDDRLDLANGFHFCHSGVSPPAA